MAGLVVWSGREDAAGCRVESARGDVDKVADSSSTYRDWDSRSWTIWRGRCCWVLLWVFGVQEYDLASTQDEKVWKSVHAGEERDVS